MVLAVGVEPTTPLRGADFKSAAYANSATPAAGGYSTSNREAIWQGPQSLMCSPYFLFCRLQYLDNWGKRIKSPCSGAVWAFFFAASITFLTPTSELASRTFPL